MKKKLYIHNTRPSDFFKNSSIRSILVTCWRFQEYRKGIKKIKSNNVLHSISTQIFQYVNSNRHQFIWIQYKFFLDTRLFRKLFQREKSLSLDPFSLISMEKSLSHSYSSRVSYVLILSSGWFTVPYRNQRFYLTILYFSDPFALSYWLLYIYSCFSSQVSWICLLAKVFRVHQRQPVSICLIKVDLLLLKNTLRSAVQTE